MLTKFIDIIEKIYDVIVPIFLLMTVVIIVAILLKAAGL